MKNYEDGEDDVVTSAMSSNAPNAPNAPSAPVSAAAATADSAAPASALTDIRRGRIPGNIGIWVGITCEFVEFALLFCVYFVARAHFPESFETGAPQLSKLAGTVITLLMVTSSYFIACSVIEIRRGQRRRSLFWLLGGFLLALCYPLAKVLEFRWNLAQGITGESGIFFTVYYYLTLTHMVHAIWGLLGMLWVIFRHSTGAYSAKDYGGLEALASYWHATDIIWLVIFPFFYVLS